MKKALALLLVGMMATAGVAQASERARCTTLGHEVSTTYLVP